MRGCIRMVGEDSIIPVPYISDLSALFPCELSHRYYQVLPLAHHNKIYAAPTNFGSQVLVHYSACFCSTATDMHDHGDILRKCTREFSRVAGAAYANESYVPASVSNPE